MLISSEIILTRHNIHVTYIVVGTPMQRIRNVALSVQKWGGGGGIIYNVNLCLKKKMKTPKRKIRIIFQTEC